VLKTYNIGIHCQPMNKCEKVKASH